MKTVPFAYVCVVLCLLLAACGKSKEEAVDLPQIIERGELTVLTVSGSTSYFNYRGEPMGFQYELAQQFARSLGVKLNVKIVKDENALVDSLLAGFQTHRKDNLAVRQPLVRNLRARLVPNDKSFGRPGILVDQLRIRELCHLTRPIHIRRVRDTDGRPAGCTTRQAEPTQQASYTYCIYCTPTSHTLTWVAFLYMPGCRHPRTGYDRSQNPMRPKPGTRQAPSGLPECPSGQPVSWR